MLHWMLVAAAVVGITAIAVAATIARERRRTRRLAELAPRLGFTFQRDGNSLLERQGLDALPLFALARLTRWSAVSNVMQGALDFRRVLICDYHYATGGPSSRTDHYQTVAAFWLGHEVLPDFSLRLAHAPRGPLPSALLMLLPRGRQLRDALTAADAQHVDIPTPAAFAARYALSAADRAAVLRCLHAEVIAYLASRPEPLLADSAGGWLALFRRRQVPVAELPAFIAQCREFVALVAR